MPTAWKPELGDEGWGEDVGETISVEEAAAILTERMGFKPGRAFTEDEHTSQHLAYQLVQLLPEELRTETVLRTMDVRTLLDHVRNHELPKEGETVTIDGVWFGKVDIESAKKFFDKVSDEGPALLKEQIVAATGMDEATAAALVVEHQDEWLANKDRIVPFVLAPPNLDRETAEGQKVTLPASGIRPPGALEATGKIDVETGAITADESVGTKRPGAPGSAAAGKSIPIDEFGNVDYGALLAEFGTEGMDLGAAPSFMSRDDLVRLNTDLDADQAYQLYLQDLDAQKAYRDDAGNPLRPPGGDPRDLSRVDVGELAPEMVQPRGTGTLEQIKAASEWEGALGGGYTLRQASQLLNTMSRAERRNLSERMKAAGVYEQIPGGEPAVLGDATDPQFKRGWKEMMSKSIQTGKSIPDLLDEMRDQRVEDEALKPGGKSILTDPARLRVQSDTLGKELIGRRLRAEERTALIEFIHGLERKEGSQRTALEEEGAEGEITAVDWEAQMTEWIQRKNAPEAAAKELANTYDLFKGMLGPAGSGTQL